MGNLSASVSLSAVAGREDLFTLCLSFHAFLLTYCDNNLNPTASHCLVWFEIPTIQTVLLRD